MVQTPVSESFGSSPFPFCLLCVWAGKEEDNKQCQNDVSKEVQNIHTATDDSEKRVAIKTHGKQCFGAVASRGDTHGRVSVSVPDLPMFK